MSPEPDTYVETAYVDLLPPVASRVAWGAIGLQGDLGYERARVVVRGTPYLHAISAHAPSKVAFRLDGRFSGFECQVALNDDVAPGASYADFRVVADGRLVGAAQRVVAGGLPVALRADVRGVATLELQADTERATFCHSVWLDPRLTTTPPDPLVDCLDRVEFARTDVPLFAKRCVATVATPGFVTLLDSLLGSIRANTGPSDLLVVVLAVDPDQECFAVAAAHGAVVVPCRSRRAPDPSIKSALYSIARVVAAEQFLCLDADMLVLGDLGPVFEALEACAAGTILACSDQNRDTYEDLGRALVGLYRGPESDIGRFVGTPLGEARCPLVLNDGAFAGDRFAMLSLDSAIRAMPGAPQWVDAYWLRNQFLFNLALARMRCGVLMDHAYNLQLHAQDVELVRENGHVGARWGGRPVRILHFNAAGRDKYREWREVYARRGSAPAATAP